jgi:hypothetical protein
MQERLDEAQAQLSATEDGGSSHETVEATQALASEVKEAAKVFLDKELFAADSDREAIRQVFFGLSSKRSHGAGTSVRDAAKALINLGETVELLASFESANHFIADNFALAKTVKAANKKATELMGHVEGWGFPVRHQGKLDEAKATKSICATFAQRRSRKPNGIMISKFLHDLELLVDGSFEVEDEMATQPPPGNPRIMTRLAYHLRVMRILIATLD